MIAGTLTNSRGRSCVAVEIQKHSRKFVDLTGKRNNERDNIDVLICNIFLLLIFTKCLNYLLLMKSQFAQMEETQLNNQLLSVRDIETALKLGHTKTYELINAGEIETFTIGRRRMTTPALLRKFIDGKINEQVRA